MAGRPQSVMGVMFTKVVGLFQEGLSRNKIAKETGLARETVRTWLQGVSRDKTETEFTPPPPFRGPYRRCPTCGGKVKMPCLSCGLERCHP